MGADRTLAVLTVLATYAEGASLEEITNAVGSPKPTVHRALAALRRAGFATQSGPGRYVLGDDFLRLAFAHHQARPDHVRVEAALVALAASSARPPTTPSSTATRSSTERRSTRRRGPSD